MIDEVPGTVHLTLTEDAEEDGVVVSGRRAHGHVTRVLSDGWWERPSLPDGTERGDRLRSRAASRGFGPLASAPGRTSGVVVLAALLTACAARVPHDRTFVSDAIEKRSGHALGPETAGADARLPDGVSLADGLSEDDAVAIALWNNAELAATLAELGFARADLAEAGLIRNPVFSLLFPVGPKQLEFTLTWPIDVLWQRPRRVAAARLDAERVAERLVQSGLDLVRDVRTAHAELLLAQERARLLEELRALRAKIGEIADARLRLGDVSVMEASAARLDAARAEEEASRSLREARSARDRLRTLMGVPGDEPPFDPAAEATPSAAPPELTALLKEALAARPDLRAAELGIEAAGRRAGLARSEILTLSAVLDANAEGKEGFEMGPGVTLELPLFGRHKGRLARAQAEMQREAKRYLATRHRIDLEVRQSLTSVLGAREALALWRDRLIPTFADNVTRADQAHTAGEVPMLAVLEAKRLHIEGRIREAEIAASLRRAAAALDHGVGKSVGRVPLQRSEVR